MRPRPLNHVDLVLPHQKVDALGVLVDDLVLAIADEGKIQARVVTVNSVFFRMQKPVPHVGCVQESLSRDASH